MRFKKTIIASVLLLAAGGAGYAYWTMNSPPKEPPYLTVPVSRGNVRQVVSSTGTLQAVVTVQVGTQVSGTIEKLNADFNSKVKAGQVVALLNQDKFRASVDQAKANVLAAQATHAKNKVAAADTLRTLERNKELRKRDVMAQSELDASQTAYDAAMAQLQVSQAQISQAQAALTQTTVDLNNTVIKSPVDGLVISRNVDVGQTVAASLSAPTLFSIANDLTKMEVHTNVDEADVGNIREGQDVTFTVDAHAQRRFRGKVHQVRNAPQVVQSVVTYIAVVRINNKDLLLKPGMTANVQFLVAQKEDALTIPNVALRFRPPEEKNEAQDLLQQEQARVGGRITQRRTSRGGGGGGGGEARRVREVKVYVLKDGKAQPLDVKVGITDGSKTEVVEGPLNENDKVIIGLGSAATQAQSGVTNPFQAQTPRFR